MLCVNPSLQRRKVRRVRDYEWRVVKGKGKVCLRAKWPIRPTLNSGFRSMKRLGILLLPPGWDASPSQGYPQHYDRRYTFFHLRRGGLVVGALDFRSRGRWFEPGHCRRVVSLDKKLYSTLSLFTQVYKWSGEWRNGKISRSLSLATRHPGLLLMPEEEAM